eukprot:TRINITY_DN3784_c0_g1_i2.p1 TRINITY_DN3784_c0_g1~~TRINITY_DN3784_c0_g1_i2.p1  ORF type:complete len:424 (+),score=92.00 TRINITY_DN3784_c0_g1_i2:1013-2284(+)
MTPIKTALRQAGLIRATDYAILFRAEDLELVSQNFKLVSASNRIPEGTNMRPRTPKNPLEMNAKPMEISRGIAPPNVLPSIAPPVQSDFRVKPQYNTSPPQAVETLSPTTADQNAHDSKRRRTDEEVVEMYVRVHVKGEENARGFIVITPNSSLKESREEIAKSPNYPKNFHFWFSKMNTIVQSHQEDFIKVTSIADKDTLILESYEPEVQSTESIIKDLWLKHKDKSPLLPILQVINTMVSLNGAEYNQSELKIITNGIYNFFVNTAKHLELNLISLEDFKLFLKFFGPSNIFKRVLNVYGETCFHGFLRHYEACELLKGKPGHFLVRFSESQLQEGFYAFNVNKGNQHQDLVENYVLPYLSNQGCFLFKDKRYLTIGDFTKDSDYSHILVSPLPKENRDEFRPPNDPDGNYDVMEQLNIMS